MSTLQANSNNYRRVSPTIVALIILSVIAIDQGLKIWVKLNFTWTEERPVLGTWFRLYFIENAGMAWGLKFGNEWGKIALTVFRLVAVLFGTWYLGKLIKERYHRGFIICASLIYAGALGNLIDSLAYGLIFDKGMLYNAAVDRYVGYQGLAQFSSEGYTRFLHGNVVDMLYFPIIENAPVPDWVPFVQRVPGQPPPTFTFFSPIFNVADAAISIGVIVLLLFQKRFFTKKADVQERTVTTGAATSDHSEVN